MTGFILRALMSAIGLWIATYWVSGIRSTMRHPDSRGRPVGNHQRDRATDRDLLTLPITILSLGFFLLVVNAGMVALVAGHSPGLSHPRRLLVRLRHRTDCLDHELGRLVAHRAARQDRRLRA